MGDKEKLVTCGCQTEGLAIFPVRYTAVPTYINKTRPSWANLTGVTTIPLNDDYQYHIRRVRAGFIYIYLPQNTANNSQPNSNSTLSEAALIEQENKYWLIYSIDEKGRFVRQTNIQSVQPVDKNDDAFKCPNLQRNPSLCSFISIPNPERYSKAYMAYSEFPWTVEAMQEYRKSPLRRMQEIDIQAWRAQQQQVSATVATKQTLSQILDFDFEFIFNKQLLHNYNSFQDDAGSQLPSIFDPTRPIFIKVEESEPDKKSAYAGVLVYNKSLHYNYEGKNLKINATRQIWNSFELGNIMVAPETDTKPIFQDIHNNHLHTLHKNMQNYSGEHGSPMILALEDALGVAEELNGYYNDIYDHLAQFQTEAKMECDVKQYFAKIRAFVESKVTKKEFDIAPYKDDLYLALSRNLTLDNVDYKGEVLKERMYKKYPQAYGMMQAYRDDPRFAEYHKLDIETKAKNWGVDTNIDVTAPMKREFYQMVKSYILLVKNYFYGKPSGNLYYTRFMNYLKYNEDKTHVFLKYNPRGEKAPEYYSNTIYEQVNKYSTFKQDASPEEIKTAAQTLHQLYQKLVAEYATNAEEYQTKFNQQVDEALEKYTSRLDATDFDRIVVELDKRVNTIANERAKQLINWLQNSHYLQFINDLSYQQKTEIAGTSPLSAEYQAKIKQELQDALNGKEITAEQMAELTCVNLNGFYFNAVFEAALRGLDACKTGQEFTKKLFDLQQLNGINVESRMHIKTHFWVLGLRAILFDHKLALQVLKNLYTSVEEKQLDAYEEIVLKNVEITTLSFFTTMFRSATLALEHFNELQRLQKLEVPARIMALDTTFGQKTVIVKWLSNYDKVGIVPAPFLKIYDSLLAICTPIGNGLYSMGAMIAESATLALAGTIWKTATVYAHLKYQLMQAWITFKSQAAPGVNVGGGFKLLSNAYSAQAKHLIKQLRDSLNTVIKQLDSRLVDNLVDIDIFFKKTLNIPFQIFSDASTARINRKQIRLRSARLAFLVGAFEVYNWQYIMDKTPSLFASDDDIKMEKIMATNSLIAATADIVASITRIVRGKHHPVFIYAKVSVGVFSGLVAFLAGAKVASGAIDHWKRGNHLAGLIGFSSAIMYFTSGSLTALWGLSYRYAWVQTFFEARLATTIAQKGVQKAFNLFAMRFLLLRFAGLIGFAALIVELLYEYFSDDEIQVWLSYSALGKYKQEQRFKLSIDQTKAFDALDKLKAEIEQSSGFNISEQQKQAIETIQQDHESILLQVENDALKWVSQ